MPRLDTSALNAHFHIAAANSNQPSLLIRQAGQLFNQMQELQTLSGHTHTIPPFAENSQWPFVEHEPLQRLLVKYGSDKHDAWHAYTGIYSTVLSSLRPRSNILEVGMGTNNTKLVSAMHSSHRPGAFPACVARFYARGQDFRSRCRSRYIRGQRSLPRTIRANFHGLGGPARPQKLTSFTRAVSSGRV